MPSTTRRSEYRPFAESTPKQRIVEAIGRFRYLTAEQLARLLYSPNSVTFVYEHCRRLLDEGYLDHLELPRLSNEGRLKRVYCLGPRGARYLAARDDGTMRFRPAEERERDYPYLEHRLYANWLLILLGKLPGLELAAFATERELKRDPIHVQVPLEAGGKERVYVCPDGWVDLRAGKEQYCLALELDNGSHERKAFQHKVRALVHYARGPYQHRFGTTSITIVFLTPRGRGRLEEMLRWTEAVLSAHEEESDLFRFAAFDPGQVEPDYLLSPVWSRPFERRSLPLIEGVPEP